MQVETSASSQKVWVEKYRPKDLTQVAHQESVVATLQNAVETGRLPHLLFYGPPGSGKTSVALALCRQLWHPDQWKRRVLELNASDERGISVVRDKIKHFASLSVGTSSSSSKGFFKKDDDTEKEEEKKYPNPGFKVIILDEADTVTPDAQAALRRIIEAHSRITRFILICNYVTRIIEPLASRCAKFRFQALPASSMKSRLQSICKQEGCELQDEILDEILMQADGDMRRAVTTLQSVHALGEADKDIVAEVSGIPPSSVIAELWTCMTTSPNFATMEKGIENVCAAGFSAQLLLTSVLQKLMVSPTLDELSKAMIAIRLAEAEKNMIEGADEFLQLMTVASLVLTCSKKKPSD